MNALRIQSDVIPVSFDADHEYTLTSELVAKGYGVSTAAIRMQKKRHADELVEGKHWIAVTNCYGGADKTLWTKRGVVRLGFFIRSERAKLFRDLAEDLVIGALEPEVSGTGPIARIEERLMFGLAGGQLSRGMLRAMYDDVLEAKAAEPAQAQTARELSLRLELGMRPRSIAVANEGSVELFLADCCRAVRGEALTSRELVAAYWDWCRGRQLTPLTAGRVEKLLPLLMRELFAAAKSRSIPAGADGPQRAGFRGVTWARAEGGAA